MGREKNQTVPVWTEYLRNTFQNRFKTAIFIAVLKRACKSRNNVFFKLPANIGSICELGVLGMGELGLVKISEKQFRYENY